MSGFSNFDIPKAGIVNAIVNGLFAVNQNGIGAMNVNANGTIKCVDCFSFVMTNRNALVVNANFASGFTLNAPVNPEPNPNNNELVYIHHRMESIYRYVLYDSVLSGGNNSGGGLLSIGYAVAISRPVTIGITFSVVGGNSYFTTAVLYPNTNIVRVPFDTSYTNGAEMDVDIHLMPSPANECASTDINKWIAPAGKSLAPGVTNFFANNTNLIVILGVSLNAGNEYIDEKRPYAKELELCQRYYQKSMSSEYGAAIAPAQNFGIANGVSSYCAAVAGAVRHRAVIKLPVKLRDPASAVITTYNPAALNANWRNVTTGADSGIPVTALNGDDVLFIDNPQTAGAAIGNDMRIGWAIDNRLS